MNFKHKSTMIVFFHSCYNFSIHFLESSFTILSIAITQPPASLCLQLRKNRDVICRRILIEFKSKQNDDFKFYFNIWCYSMNYLNSVFFKSSVTQFLKFVKFFVFSIDFKSSLMKSHE